MPVDSGQTAILIFSRTASQEAQVKTFDRYAGQSTNRVIVQRLIDHTVDTARQTQLPVFIHYDTKPSTGTFGTHLAEALESVFEKGYTSIIAIGNDCPELSAPMLLEAHARLTKQPLVLGPATDGGLYLIGIQKSAYHRQSFVNLPWETAQLQSAWQRYPAANEANIDWLEPLSDVDHAADFKNLLTRLPRWNRLLKQLRSILASFAVAASSFCQSVLSQAPFGLAPLRGPPFPLI